MIRKLLILLVTLFFFSSCAPTRVRMVTYNVGVFHKYDDNSTDMVASMMKELGVDIISLNELDSMTNRTGRRYQLKEFADKMGDGWDYRFGRAIPHDGGSYGVGIAASPKFKVTDSWIVPLGKFDGSEARTMVVVETEKFVFATTHLDHKSVNAQNEQAKRIDSWMKEKYGRSNKTVILCGDLNARPESEVISILKEGWTVVSNDSCSFPSTNPDRCIDYILIFNNNAKYKIIDTFIPDSFGNGNVRIASDHLPVFAEILLN